MTDLTGPAAVAAVTAPTFASEPLETQGDLLTRALAHTLGLPGPWHPVLRRAAHEAGLHPEREDLLELLDQHRVRIQRWAHQVLDADLWAEVTTWDSPTFLRVALAGRPQQHGAELRQWLELLGPSALQTAATQPLQAGATLEALAWAATHPTPFRDWDRASQIAWWRLPLKTVASDWAQIDLHTLVTDAPHLDDWARPFLPIDEGSMHDAWVRRWGVVWTGAWADAWPALGTPMATRLVAAHHPGHDAAWVDLVWRLQRTSDSALWQQIWARTLAEGELAVQRQMAFALIQDPVRRTDAALLQTILAWGRAIGDRRFARTLLVRGDAAPEVLRGAQQDVDAL